MIEELSLDGLDLVVAGGTNDCCECVTEYFEFGWLDFSLFPSIVIATSTPWKFDCKQYCCADLSGLKYKAEKNGTFANCPNHERFSWWDFFLRAVTVWSSQ